MNIFRKVESAKWALCLHLKPFYATLFVEIVFNITIEDYDLVVGNEIDETNYTVRHIRVFFLVLLVANML